MLALALSMLIGPRPTQYRQRARKRAFWANTKKNAKHLSTHEATPTDDCPSHAKVLKDFVIFTKDVKGVVRTGKATVQRSQTLRMYENEIERLYEAAALPNTSPETPIDAGTVRKPYSLQDGLTRIISGCNWLNGNLKASADLFELGLDSLQVISLSK